MSTLAQRCEAAQRLFEVEARLRAKTATATTESAQVGYAQACLEIIRESHAHFSGCEACKAAIAENLQVAA